jgi:hypothetical protein
MNDMLISLFIDDEMDLDEKITFVETVHDSQRFADEAVALLQQEKILRDIPMPAIALAKLSDTVGLSGLNRFRLWWPPMAGFATAMLLVGLGFLFVPGPERPIPAEEHRFVLYLPQVNQARIIGTFTGWNPLPMRRIGSSGYWDLTVKVPRGEHRYSYLVDEGNKITDPTVATREHDDFGGENSVIVIGEGDDPVS